MFYTFTSMIKLKEIVSIRTGSTETVGSVNGQEIRLVKMKSINHYSQTINWEDAETLYVEDRSLRYLSKDEILIVAKGERNTAVLLNEIPFPSLASNHFFILTLLPDANNIIDPGYLTWYLNYVAKQYIEANSTGAVISNLRKETLVHLEMPLPDISEQRHIVDVYQVMLKQKRVFDELFQDRITLLIERVSKFK
jgi:restriction endonuclease S subunit